MTFDRETGKTWPITDQSDNSVYGLSDLDCTSLSKKTAYEASSMHGDER